MQLCVLRYFASQLHTTRKGSITQAIIHCYIKLSCESHKLPKFRVKDNDPLVEFMHIRLGILLLMLKIQATGNKSNSKARTTEPHSTIGGTREHQKNSSNRIKSTRCSTFRHPLLSDSASKFFAIIILI